MKAYFDTVPSDLDESARVDGASYFQAFRYVVLPLVRPILAVIAHSDLHRHVQRFPAGAGGADG